MRGKPSHWILIYLRITTISALHQTKLSIKFFVRLQFQDNKVECSDEGQSHKHDNMPGNH